MSLNFYQFGRLGSDPVDMTRKDLDNTRQANYMLGGFGNNSLGTPSDLHVKFATNQPAVMFNGVTNGNGLNSEVVDYESFLRLKGGQERPLEKLQLFERPFRTIPFLGRGGGNPVIESRLLQGEPTIEPRSTSSAMEQSHLGNAFYPTDDNMEQKVVDTRFTVEESALEGWIRGGSNTRQ